MTDRLKGLTVLLDRDIREDDAAPIIAAIQMIKGVASVQTHVADPDHYLAVETARWELRKEIWKVVNPTPTKGGSHAQ